MMMRHAPSLYFPYNFIFVSSSSFFGTTAAVGMAETDVASPPLVPLEEPVGKDAPEKREGKPERPRREPEDIPEMTVEEAHKALNALPKVNIRIVGASTKFQYKTNIHRVRPKCYEVSRR